MGTTPPANIAALAQEQDWAYVTTWILNILDERLISPRVLRGRLSADYSIVAATGALPEYLHAPVLLFPAAVLVWHYLITFDKEVTFFWRRKLTAACALFLANRYLAFLTAALNEASWPGSRTLTGHQCTITVYIYILALFGQYIVWAIFSCLRVYALRREWTWVALIVVLSLVPICTLIVFLAYTRSGTGKGAACYTLARPPDLSDTIYNGLGILTRASLALADAIVVVITWSVTYSNRNADAILGKGTSLSTVLFRDGSIYFAALTLFNFLLVIFMAASLTQPDDPSVRAGENSVVSYFISPLTTIAMDCFLIDLHEAAAAGCAPDERSRWSGGTLRFARGFSGTGTGTGTSAES